MIRNGASHDAFRAENKNSAFRGVCSVRVGLPFGARFRESECHSRTTNPSSFWIASESQRTQLSLTESFGRGGQVFLATLHSTQDCHRDERERSGQRVAQRAFRMVFENLSQVIGEAFKQRAFGGATRLHFLFDHRPSLGQFRCSQFSWRIFDQ